MTGSNVSLNRRTAVADHRPGGDDGASASRISADCKHRLSRLTPRFLQR
ncbi:hypothetical protein [Pseudohalioglobus lutimaris]|nr:hypothetical protein [Pseudohalioglobus lutimaris]